jgi:uncharacterized protein YecE (DUF72 family)
MKNMGGKIFIGTSGWHYKHWIGKFYPESLKQREHFNFYTEHFGTVEINNSFYKLPTEKTFSEWKASAPPDFTYAVKASRYITHMKKLKDPKSSFEKFFNNIVYLENTLCPILFQLPPKWRFHRERLKYFLEALPSGYKYAMEFREPSWYNEEVYELLKTHNVAFCIYELEYHLSPTVVTSSHVYVRLHGPEKKYQGKYSQKNLEHWAKMCKNWISDGLDVYFYFDNDENGYAPHNALSLKKLVEK